MKRSPFRESFKLGFKGGFTLFPVSIVSIFSEDSYDKYIEHFKKDIRELRTEFRENRRTLDVGAQTGMYSGLATIGTVIFGVMAGAINITDKIYGREYPIENMLDFF